MDNNDISPFHTKSGKTINVFMKDNDIVVEYRGRQYTRNINTFLKLNVRNINDENYCKELDSVNMGQFEELQRIIRYYDSIKDGKGIDPYFIQETYYKNTPNYLKRSKKPLDKLEECIYTLRKDHITSMAWTKEKSTNGGKGKDSIEKYPIKYIFHEAGLSPMKFIDTKVRPIYIFNVANKVLDSFKRDDSQHPSTEVFPGPNETINIDKSFFKTFGLGRKGLNISMSAKTKSISDYELNITLSDGKNDFIIDERTIQKYNQGNKKKGDIITYGDDKTIAKHGMIIMKEMGDLMQVLFMMIWGMINEEERDIKSNEFAICSHDKAVIAMSQFLGLQCTYAPVVGDMDNRDKKMYKVELYSPLSHSPEQEFNIMKDKIIIHNEYYIGLCNDILYTNNKPMIESISLGSQAAIKKSEFKKIAEFVSGISRKIKDLNKYLHELQYVDIDDDETIESTISKRFEVLPFLAQKPPKVSGGKQKKQSTIFIASQTPKLTALSNTQSDMYFDTRKKSFRDSLNYNFKQYDQVSTNSRSRKRGHDDIIDSSQLTSVNPGRKKIKSTIFDTRRERYQGGGFQDKVLLNLYQTLLYDICTLIHRKRMNWADEDLVFDFYHIFARLFRLAGEVSYMENKPDTDGYASSKTLEELYTENLGTYFSEPDTSELIDSLSTEEPTMEYAHELAESLIVYLGLDDDHPDDTSSYSESPGSTRTNSSDTVQAMIVEEDTDAKSMVPSSLATGRSPTDYAMVSSNSNSPVSPLGTGGTKKRKQCKKKYNTIKKGKKPKKKSTYKQKKSTRKHKNTYRKKNQSSTFGARKKRM